MKKQYEWGKITTAPYPVPTEQRTIPGMPRWLIVFCYVGWTAAVFCPQFFPSLANNSTPIAWWAFLYFSTFLFVFWTFPVKHVISPNGAGDASLASHTMCCGASTVGVTWLSEIESAELVEKWGCCGRCPALVVTLTDDAFQKRVDAYEKQVQKTHTGFKCCVCKPSKQAQLDMNDGFLRLLGLDADVQPSDATGGARANQVFPQCDLEAADRHLVVGA